jgi:hypothetical protein
MQLPSNGRTFRRVAFPPERMETAIEELQIEDGKVPGQDRAQCIPIAPSLEVIQLPLNTRKPARLRNRQGPTPEAKHHANDIQQKLVRRSGQFERLARLAGGL